jgi:hypothetical protein
MTSGIYKRTEETRKKLREINLGKHNSPQTEFKKGRKISEETRKKMSIAKKGIVIRHTPETKIKISAIQQGIQVSEWKGFLTRPDFRERKSREYNQWRMNVFLRDNFTCQFCGIKGCYLEAHHIKSFKHFPELRFDINNGVSLCKKCHNLTKQGRRSKNVTPERISQQKDY